MTNGLAIEFNLRIRHAGFEADFYHDNSDSLTLSPETQAEYNAAKDTSRIFIQNKGNEAFSAENLLTWKLDKEGEFLENFLSPEEATKAFNEGMAVFPVNFQINFPPDSFHLETNEGPVDLRRLTLIVEFTVTPKKQS